MYSQLLLIGRTLLEGFVAAQGDGDVGPTLEQEDRTLQRSEEVQPRRYLSIFGELTIGLLAAIGVILLLLTANFQSLKLALVVLSTAPAVLAGSVLMLFLRGFCWRAWLPVPPRRRP